eukprot:CAMPEP_0194368268 /NCGR_PEP_ID=MMETSP0174-20130528/16512_1 /TAXON_ID=216777 /ORGANISM="Proboscia alata, Strain PI-D3" /LENGTH=145 /DNA_ID=CAMNT_0039144557 /DNA_START=20 /DNA_END=454 /DNA_ORIENTATION=-
MVPSLSPVTQAPSERPTPHAVANYHERKSLTSTFNGFNGSYGSMFDVTNVHAVEDIVIRSLDINANTTKTVWAEVWTKPDTFRGYEHKQAKWKRIFGTLVHGAGLGKPLRLAENFEPVVLRAGLTQALYVTLDQPVLKYSNAVGK